MPAENLHLTLRFIGSVDRRLAESVAERLEAESPSGFDIALGDLGAFKRGRLARVVWLGVRVGSEASSRLAAQIDSACRAAGLDGEERPFTPHVTLARARHRDGSELPPLPAVPMLDAWRVDELVLYRSRLGRLGAVYEPLRRVALKVAEGP